MGTALQGVLRAKFKLGVKDHFVGNHPLWEIFRTVYQMMHRPYVFGGLALACGFVSSMVSRTKIPLTPDMVRFAREEQMHRLKNFLTGSASAERVRSKTEPPAFR
jgi:hypothetical protein